MSTTDIVAVDIGGTHARFALARVMPGGGVEIGDVTTLATGERSGLAEAWHAFAARQPRPLPRAAAIAVACPVEGDVVRLTNNSWTIDRRDIGRALGIDRHLVLNDFEAVAHAVAALPGDAFAHVTGPTGARAMQGVTSVVGPGTGLGVAQIVRHAHGIAVIATEGGHIGFAPACPLDDRLLALLRARHGRVSAERVVAGPGLRALADALGVAPAGALGGEPDDDADADADADLWRRALDGDAALAPALDAFCRSLGSVAGDIALAQGANAVVVAGGLGLRLANVLPRSSFAAGFTGKGRFNARMAALPVRVVTHPQPGLFGAAAAFAREHRA